MSVKAPRSAMLFCHVQGATAERDAGEENWDSNRPADVYLPSPDRVDKAPKQWNIPAEACKGSADRARKGSRLAVASLAAAVKERINVLELGDVQPKVAEDKARPDRKRRKGVA